jgi:multicomponent Na+:H+ antiporter subunit D
MISLFVVIPLFTAFIISLVGKFSKRFSDIIANLSSLLLVVLSFVSLYKLRAADHGIIIHQMGKWIPPFGICFVLDGLSIFMLVTINIVAFCAILFSMSYMEKYTDKWKYYTLFMLMLTGLNGVAVTGDMFNLFVWLEIGAISSYALVAFGTEAEELEASFKYAVMGSSASLFILIGIAMLYSYTSTLNMADISQTLITKPNSTLIGFITVLFLLGFGLKSALVPFHSWLPDAHPSAPAPISAMLSGVLIKSLGIYALVRVIFNILGIAGGGG